MSSLLAQTQSPRFENFLATVLHIHTHALSNERESSAVNTGATSRNNLFFQKCRRRELCFDH